MTRSTGSSCEFWWSYWRSVVSKTSYAFFASLLLLAGCSAQVEPVERIPGECYQQTAKAFVSGTATCGDPFTAATCAFDAHNDPTPLDSSGNPLAYYCTCGETGVYTCWRVEWFVEPDPL